MPEIKNAKIHSTFLGYEERGILTCFIRLDYGSMSQSFGGYNLEYFGVDMISKILKVVQVESWEELRGKHVRVYIDNSKTIRRIGNILEDIWYSPENL